MAKAIADAGYRVTATDLAAYENADFPAVAGIDALEAPLPTRARTIVTNPPYGKRILPQLVRHWLRILNPVGGQLCLLLRVRWGESKGGQALTTRHPAYAGKLKTPRRIPLVRRNAAAPRRLGPGRACVVHLGLAQGSNANAVRCLRWRSAVAGL